MCLVSSDIKGEYQVSWIEVIDWCESPHECWELNTGPLPEKTRIFCPKSSFQPYSDFYLIVLLNEKHQVHI